MKMATMPRTVGHNSEPRVFSLSGSDHLHPIRHRPPQRKGDPQHAATVHPNHTQTHTVHCHGLESKQRCQLLKVLVTEFLDSPAQVRGKKKYFFNLTLYTCSPQQPGTYSTLCPAFYFRVAHYFFFFRHTLLSVKTLARHVNTTIHSCFFFFRAASTGPAPRTRSRISEQSFFHPRQSFFSARMICVKRPTSMG